MEYFSIFLLLLTNITASWLFPFRTIKIRKKYETRPHAETETNALQCECKSSLENKTNRNKTNVSQITLLQCDRNVSISCC